MDMKYCVAIMGSPQHPECEWSKENLAELWELGFRSIQLNIAWGDRPGDEPLNLEDVLELQEQEAKSRELAVHRREKIRERVRLCRQFGFRTILHFGAPYNGQEAYAGIPPRQCISDPGVAGRYRELLEELGRQIPGIDDILVYTYDQDAWLCSEFTGCLRCRGVALHNRLPGFLDALCGKWRQISPEGILWWEPWELSAGQVLKTVESLPGQNFGIMAHSNIGEVQKTRPSDLWLRNMAGLCRKKGIPLVVELFLAECSEETQPLSRVPAPGLTYSQIKAVTELEGVVGIKEYYGLLPGTNDPCLGMVGEMLKNPGAGKDICLWRLAEPYGKKAGDVVLFWKRVEEGYLLYPWDVSWFAREIGKADVDHGWGGAYIRGQQCDTPSWDSTRHGVFMKTDNGPSHPWMLEDVGLRCMMAAEVLRDASSRAACLAEEAEEARKIQFEEAAESLKQFYRVCVSYALHLRETNVAMLLREDLRCGRNLQAGLVAEMGGLLAADEENQGYTGRVVNIASAWREDPVSWLHLYLLPVMEERLEKGAFTLTTR